MPYPENGLWLEANYGAPNNQPGLFKAKADVIATA
jgi:hypothetical protein